jgi:Rrf2 family protein
MLLLYTTSKVVYLGGMISQKAKYAFKALAYLAAQPKDRPAQIEDIAGEAALPRKFLEHILLDLKRVGIVASRRGRFGGYVLIRSPRDLSIGSVLRAIDGPIAPIPCISRTAYRRCADCADEKTCVVRRLFADTYAATLLLMEGTTLSEILDGGSPAGNMIPAE